MIGNRAVDTVPGAVSDAFAPLATRLDDRTARLAVVGLGFVGTPVACTLAGAGYTVVGVDVVAVAMGFGDHRGAPGVV